VKREVFSTYQVARICNVHHTTVINWVKEGKLDAYTTPGGHRRIKKESILAFAEKFGIPVSGEIMREKKKVLIVDDDVEMLEEMKEALSGDHFDLDFASDGFEAGMCVFRDKPDLIILDFKMPGLDGFEVCDILHRDEETANIPIIAVTVLRSDDAVKRIKECGVKEYMPKPVDIEKLIRTIKKTLKL